MKNGIHRMVAGPFGGQALRHGYLAEARVLIAVGLQLAPDAPAREPFAAWPQQLGEPK